MFPKDNDFEAKISLESEKGGVIEEPAFRFLVIGDWSGDGAKKSLDQRRPIQIDRDNFDEVLEKMRASLEIDIHNDGNVISLEFRELDDFHPDVIFRQVPLFSDLRDLRRRLSGADTFNAAANEVRSWMKEEEKSVQAADDEPASPISGNILDQILSGDSVPKKQVSGSNELNDLLGRIVKPHLVGFDENEQSRLIAAVDEATSDLMRRILHDPQFQSLEAAWRGLYFLVKRAETDVDLKIFILNFSKTELVDNLKSVSDLKESVMYRWLVSEADDKLGGEPWAFVCGNYSFEPTVEDTATLIRLTKISNIADAPFISSVSSEFVGIRSFEQPPASEDWDFSEDTSAGKLWATLRSLPESDYLGLMLTRFLARLPYGNSTEPLDNFDFEELSEQSVHEQYLWANSCFIGALLLAESYRANGWQMKRRFVQDLEELPVHIYKSEGETIMKPCAEVIFTQSACEKMIEHGLMPLLSYRNTDRVRLAIVQSVSKTSPALNGGWE